MKRVAWVVFSWIALITTVQAASFDCEKAASKVDKLICADATLSKLDEELARVYQQSFKQATNKQVMTKDQRQWLKERNLCTNSDCLEISYRGRIGELSPEQDRFITLLAKDKSLCDTYKRYVEREVATEYQYGHYTSPTCQRSFGEGFPEFTPVKWHEINLDDHPELAVQAYRYINFWPWSNPQVASQLVDRQYKDQLEGIKLNYSNNWWHMWLGEADIGNNGHLETLLRVEDGRCGGESTTERPPRWSISVMVVDATGKNIDTIKSEWINAVSVLPPIAINPTVGIHGFGLTAYDVFQVFGKYYFDLWDDQWTNRHDEPYDPRYSKLTVYRISKEEADTICLLKFRKEPTSN